MPRPPIKDDGRESLIEVFHDIQQHHNYIPPHALQAAARSLGFSDTQAFGVASFYSYFSTLPRGKYIIRVCTSSPCMMDGSDDLLKALEDELGIRVGETTKDGEFTLETTECVGQCGNTPILTVNRQPYPRVDINKISDLIADLRRASQKEGI